ncbi:GCN5 family acetyltransferase [Pseudomonas sp. DTU12.3]|uniref:GCN5 family acetyltransferase n=1 Tax=Pseudomonas sp. DTU12.3 TaxID=2073078 RepID=UPI001010E702|nr:GCN5 family acetyltransferase [Pseudomonas sp. DTU12.3]QAX83240.1 GCN5 family acetyltransferase [Pseudomonas sp. DTU12.3]
MFDLLKLLTDNSPSLTNDMQVWFEKYRADAAWNVYSDYCVGNTDKANDSFSFVITLRHDTDQNFSEYIANVAPKDLKKTRQASEGLISYLNFPVTFSVSFIVERESKLLRDFITNENIHDFCLGLRELIALWSAEPEADREYWKRIDKALGEFAFDVKRKKFNAKLARQVLLTSTFAAFLFLTLNQLKEPSHLRWVTDRDATFEKYNEVAFDIAYILFLLFRLQSGAVKYPNKPQFLFAYPYMDGKTDYAAHVRLPDYLAGLCADIKLPSMEFSHTKFERIFGDAIINSTNNVVLQILGNSEKITARRLTFKA